MARRFAGDAIIRRWPLASSWASWGCGSSSAPSAGNPSLPDYLLGLGGGNSSSSSSNPLGNLGAHPKALLQVPSSPNLPTAHHTGSLYPNLGPIPGPPGLGPVPPVLGIPGATDYWRHIWRDFESFIGL